MHQDDNRPEHRRQTHPGSRPVRTMDDNKTASSRSTHAVPPRPVGTTSSEAGVPMLETGSPSPGSARRQRPTSGCVSVPPRCATWRSPAWTGCRQRRRRTDQVITPIRYACGWCAAERGRWAADETLWSTPWWLDTSCSGMPGGCITSPSHPTRERSASYCLLLPSPFHSAVGKSLVAPTPPRYVSWWRTPTWLRRRCPI